MTKYYRVTKDHPVWEVGAIISNELGSTSYYAVDDVWNKTGSNGKEFSDMSDAAALVENQPSFYERVYKGGAKKDKFVTRDVALKAYDVEQAK